jgi:hypothetical protein
VSGAGGAFHHPSTTYDNEICEQVLYPPENESRRAVADRLFKFWNVVQGGYVWLAGLIIAFTLFLGVTIPKSSREFISNFGFLNTLQLTEWERIGPTILQLDDVSPCAPVQPYSLWTRLGVVSGAWQPPTSCTPANPGYFFPEVSTWPPDLMIGQGFIWVSLVATLVLFYVAVFTKRIFDDTASPFEKRNLNLKVVPIVAVIAVLTIIGLLTVQPYRDHITPFVSSLIVLYSIIVAITAIVVNVRYGEYLFRKSFVPATDTGLRASISTFIDYYFPWALWVLAIIAVSFGLWFFGKNNLPAYLISDIVFIVVLVGATAGIILLSFKASGDLLSRQNKVVRFVGKLLIGVWHLLLQLLARLGIGSDPACAANPPGEIFTIEEQPSGIIAAVVGIWRCDADPAIHHANVSAVATGVHRHYRVDCTSARAVCGRSRRDSLLSLDWLVLCGLLCV